jgi:TolB protein
LAYHSEENESGGIHIRELATGNDVRLTKYAEDVTPDWAPDNVQLAFPSQRAGDRQWRIYLDWANRTEGESELIGEGRTPGWAPDGTRLAYQGDNQGNNPGLYVLELNRNSATQLTDHEADRAPAWSPACRNASTCQIAFMSSRAGSWQIFLVDVASGVIQQLTQANGNSGLPTWSPDGSHIAFVSDRDGSWGVYVMPIAGGGATKIADWPGAREDWLVERLSWGP